MTSSGGYATSQDALMVTIVGLSNTYGLVVIVFLLGYGIVELPKQMWMVRARLHPHWIAIEFATCFLSCADRRRHEP
jgi:hypothetical protein